VLAWGAPLRAQLIDEASKAKAAAQKSRSKTSISSGEESLDSERDAELKKAAEAVKNDKAAAKTGKEIGKEDEAAALKKKLACLKDGSCSDEEAKKPGAPSAAAALKAKKANAASAWTGSKPGAASPKGTLAPKGPPPPRSASDGDAPPASKDPPAGETRSDRVLRRARDSAETLRRSLANPDSDAGAPAHDEERSPEAFTPRPDFLPAPRRDATAGPDPTEPRTASDLVLAAHSGFGPSIRSLGYKIGRGPRGASTVLRADGRPASAAEVAALGAALRREPAALMRRPDFFQVLPRADFEELKADYRARPAWSGTVFRDIGMTPAYRDFRWSASCSPLSGDCNPAAGGESYRRGEDVPPESLKEVLVSARSEDESASAGGEDEDDDDFDDYTDDERREAAAADFAESRMLAARRRGPTLAGLLGTLGALAGDARDLAGFGGERRSAGSAPAGEAGWSAGPSRSPGRPASAPAAVSRDAGEREVPPIPAPAPFKTDRRGAAGWAGLAAAVFVLWRLSRRG
jgi:hypothetical protein